MNINQERLARIESLTIYSGSHAPPTGDVIVGCTAELVAWVNGEEWSDHPDCGCPVILAFVRPWNDGIRDDATRTRIMRDLIPRLGGTRSTRAVEMRRMWMAVDWDIRVRTPAFLRLLPSLEAHAAALESLPEIVDAETLRAARIAVQAARNASYAGASAAAASYAAAAASYAAVAASYAAAYAAKETFHKRLSALVAEMQASAQTLVIRMCEMK